MRITIILLLLPLFTSCRTKTIITTYPRSFEVMINERSYGPSPAEIVLRNRTFGDFRLVLLDEGGNQVFWDLLEARTNGAGIIWPPLVGLFTNLKRVLPEYEIDVSAVTSLDGMPVYHPSEERPDPPLWPRRRGLKGWVDTGFEFLDKGWLSRATFWFERALRVDPTYPDPMLGLAIYHRQKGENEEAQEWLKKYQDALNTFQSYPPP